MEINKFGENSYETFARRDNYSFNYLTYDFLFYGFMILFLSKILELDVAFVVIALKINLCVTFSSNG